MSTTAFIPARPGMAAPQMPASLLAPARPSTAAPPMFAGFDAVAADPGLAMREDRASTTWTGPELDVIPAESNLPYVDLKAKLVQLVDRCWTAASADTGRARSGVQIGGGARAQHIPGLVNQLQSSFAPANIFQADLVRQRNAPYAKQVYPVNQSTLPKGAAYATDWNLTNEMERVNAYTFRGESRDPNAIAAAKGFCPPVSRTDEDAINRQIYPKFKFYMKRRFGMELDRATFDRVYKQEVVYPQDKILMRNFFVWWGMVETESLHIGQMVDEQTLKAYISTSRAYSVAKGFCGVGGWVYLTLVCGGFKIPERGKISWATRSEGEVAHLGPIPWEKIFAFRKVGESERFTGPIYVRNGFSVRNPAACQKALRLFSGESQRTGQ